MYVCMDIDTHLYVGMWKRRHIYQRDKMIQVDSF